MTDNPIISFESILGTGKTKLIQQISDALNVRSFDEPFELNPYFKDSYSNPEVFAILAQIWFGVKRTEIHQLATAECLYGTEYDAAVIDRGLYGDDAIERYYYSKGFIKHRDHEMYRMLINQLISRFKAPSMIIYLDVEPAVALRRIKSRGRDAEKNIDINMLAGMRDQNYDMLIRAEKGYYSNLAKSVIVRRIPWNVDYQDPNIVIDTILKEFPHIRRRTKVKRHPRP